MLSVKNLVKTYKSSGGIEVRALDGVSIDFPEKGMVFLLGRSGSGKSTLLNVSGGLDSPTGGEIIVKGRSSKDFSSADFDSYRNTYVGFVFQEYNLLNEFTVEQNVAIALQLQNKENDKQAVDALLEKVDLKGVGKRSPNTLSGGQRQRVAIARALIKDPKIIMADEPTGALDSNTGKQILDTLKKLSEDRLVIVVSHDKDFAEEYADRIIELSDGKIVSDRSKVEDNSINEQNIQIVSDDTITVKDWNKVTDEEIKNIVSVMRSKGGETVITAGKKELPEVKKILKISDGEKRFKKTDKVENKKYDGNKTEFIKSRLPMRYALKMSGAGLKVKPLRLFFTILLSLIAFTVFGVTSTLMMYDPNYSIATAMEKSYYDSVLLEKRYDAVKQSVRARANGSEEVTREESATLVGAYTKSDLDKLNDNKVGLDFAGIIDFGSYDYTGLGVGDYERPKLSIKYASPKDDFTWYYTLKEINGFTDCGEEFLTNNGFTAVTENSRYPQKYNEIAIPYFLYEYYKNSSIVSIQMPVLDTPEALIGQWIFIGELPFEVVGIYDVGAVPSKYAELYDKNSDMNYHERTSLSAEFEDYLKNSFHNVCFVSEDFYEHYQFEFMDIAKDEIHGAKISEASLKYENITNKNNLLVFTERSIDTYHHAVKFYDLQGNEKTSGIGDTEIYISAQEVFNTNGLTFYNKVKENGDYIEFCRVFNKSNSSKTPRDVDYLCKIIVSDYNKVMGKELFNNKTYFIKNAHDKVSSDGTQITLAGIYSVLAEKTFVKEEYFISDALYEQFNIPVSSVASTTTDNTEQTKYLSRHKVDAKNERYGTVLTLTNNTEAQSYFMLNGRANGVNYAMLNLVYDSSYLMADAFAQMNLAFLIAGIVFGAFAALMMFNFISVTIENKKNEIGVLRAVGARGIDVFKIFITEALIITAICFLLSTVTSAILCAVINALATQSIISISFLNFRFVNVLIILGISVLIAVIATILPVIKAARRSPVESIRAI